MNRIDRTLSDIVLTLQPREHAMTNLRFALAEFVLTSFAVLTACGIGMPGAIGQLQHLHADLDAGINEAAMFAQTREAFHRLVAALGHMHANDGGSVDFGGLTSEGPK